MVLSRAKPKYNGAKQDGRRGRREGGEMREGKGALGGEGRRGWMIRGCPRIVIYKRSPFREPAPPSRHEAPPRPPPPPPPGPSSAGSRLAGARSFSVLQSLTADVDG